jgi:hypothetical protein
MSSHLSWGRDEKGDDGADQKGRAVEVAGQKKRDSTDQRHTSQGHFTGMTRAEGSNRKERGNAEIGDRISGHSLMIDRIGGNFRHDPCAEIGHKPATSAGRQRRGYAEQHERREVVRGSRCTTILHE